MVLPAILAAVAAAVTSAAATYGLNKLDEGGAPGAGTPEQFRKIRTGTPEASKFQKQLFKKEGLLKKNPLYRKGSNFLKELLSGSPEAFQNFEAPYMQNFQENILPDIANRFAGMGTGNSGLSSSGFQQTLAQAGRGLQRDLAAMRSGLQMQALPQALQYAQQPLTNQLAAMQWSPYTTTHTPRQAGTYDYLAQIAPGLIQNAINGMGQTQNQTPPTQNQTTPMQPGGIGTEGNFNPNLYQY